MEHVTPDNVKLVLHYVDFTKNSVCYCLRQAFAHNFTPSAYRYSDDPKKLRSQIEIYTSFPKTDVRYPTITVGTSSGDIGVTSIGDEKNEPVLDADGNQTGFRYSGTMKIPVRIQIYAGSTTDRDVITDLVAIYVRFVFRDLFYENRLNYIGVEAGEDGEEEKKNIPGEFIYKGKVDFDVTVEFEQEIPLDLYDLISSINLSAINFEV
jgi:hypothetical protein